MALKGDLASVDLAQVFQMLALNQKVGMLCISSASRGFKALYFEPRGTCLYFNEHVLLERVLLRSTRTGRLTPEIVQDAREHSSTNSMPIADAVVAVGGLGEEELAEMIGEEMEEEIYDLFFWDDAHFEFFEGARTVDGRDGQIDARFCFATDTLIMEAARRIDEWSFIQERISGPLEIFRACEDASGLMDLDDSTLAVWELVDGKRNVARLIESTGLPSFLVYKGLAVLLDHRQVEPVAAEDLIYIAEECVQEGRFQDAINLYERAISLGEGIPESHKQVAAVYETLQEYELATYHHKCVAEFHAAGGDPRRAVEILHHVIELLPTDLAARERLVELTVSNPGLGGKGFDPVATGKQLVDLWLVVGEVDRVRGILERLLRDNPADVELKKSLINVHTKAGDTKRVIELYESIAADLVHSRKPLEAIKYLQKILILDRSRKDVSERIRSLYVLDERRRSRRRSLAGLAAVAVVLAGLAAVWWFHEQQGREELVRIEREMNQLVAVGDFAQAIAGYEAFIQRYRLTLVAREARAERARIESLEQAHRQKLEGLRRDEQERKRRIRQRYQLGWEVFKEHVAAMDLDKALHQAESVRDMVGEAGEAEDQLWAQRVNLEGEIRATAQYLAEAADLDRRAFEAYEGGDWQTARALWLRLIAEKEMSERARAARLPVMVRSRPAGARVLVAGQPLTEEGPDGVRDKVTPCLLLVEAGRPTTVELQLEGFETRRVPIDPKAVETVDAVLTIVPLERLAFEEPVRGAVSAHRGFVAVGLRSGRIGLVRLGETPQRLVHRLSGSLDDLHGSVSLGSSTAIFATREGRLSALSLTTGDPVWSVSLPSPPLSDVQVVNQRVLVVDTALRLVAWDAYRGGDGKWLWYQPLGSHPAGPVFAQDRWLHVALQDGRILVIDASDGKVRQTLEAPAGRAAGGRAIGLTTRAPFANGVWIAGTEDGRVVAVRDGGQRLAWSVALGDDDVATAVEILNESVLVATRQGRVLRLGLRDGAEEARTRLHGQITSGPALGGGRVYFTLRVVEEDGREADVLIALGVQDLEPVWDYRESARFTSGVVVNGDDVWLGDSTGRLVRFR